MSKYMAVSLIVEVDDDSTDHFERLEQAVSGMFCPTHNNPDDFGGPCRMVSMSSTTVPTVSQAYDWQEAP